ncbi:MAG: PLP-dependent aminotransferase family protein [Synergistetes bacterium HGW-Synergistetes-1]|nr:MAG: PLP-dependent aminotransferase family protein [Synergistetes bacterium HGW-Synergistetes-1]
MATEAKFVFRDQLSTMAKERLEPSEIGEMIKLTIENDAISFTAGEPSADIYPLAELKEAFKNVFDETSLLAYYKDDFGLIELRDWIAARMLVDGIAPGWVSSENILLTNGAGEAIQLVSEALIDPGSVVLVESPTYTESLLTFRKQGAQCLSVPSDDEGIVPEALEDILSKRSVRFLYTIPNFQNPSGRTASLERRKKILEVAEKFDVPILEDDPYHYLSYDRVTPDSYLKLAGEDKRVIHTNSFSKTVAPGMRCGWAVIPGSLIKQMNALRVSAGLTRAAIVQKGLVNYLQSIDFNERVNFLCDTYRVRRNGMMKAIADHLDPLGIKTNYPSGGFFVWAEVPFIDDVKSFARFAVVEKKIGIIPGSAFFTQDEAHKGNNSFRISFAKVSPDVAKDGVLRLADAFDSYSSNRL